MSESGKFDGMEEMDDFTVRGAEGRAFGPEEDITGAAGIERPLDPAEDVEDDEPTLRPRTLDEFVGQEELKQNLRIFVEAAKRRGEALDHMLLAGPPGLGKTSLCRILAGEMGVDIQVTSGPSLERAGDMAAILTQLEEGDFLFIDEIHRLNRQIEEVLYPAMEDYAMDIVLGQGPSARTIRMDVPRFTLVGATTRTGLMTKPLLDRFGFNARLDYYAPEDLKKIVVRNAAILKIQITEAGADELAALPTWKEPEEVRRRIRLAVATRPGAPRPKGDVVVFEIEEWPISSTEIRRRIARGEPIDDMVDPLVAREIERRGLYAGERG